VLLEAEGIPCIT